MNVTIHLTAINPNSDAQTDRFNTLKIKGGCSYSILLQVGFCVPGLLPNQRCALTAPFHLYQYLAAAQAASAKTLAVFFLCHFP
jgi:hypothetical protein